MAQHARFCKYYRLNNMFVPWSKNTHYLYGHARDWVSYTFFLEYDKHYSQDPKQHHQMHTFMQPFIKETHERFVEETVQALSIFKLKSEPRCHRRFVPGYATEFLDC